jgi:hypothetical protein
LPTCTVEIGHPPPRRRTAEDSFGLEDIRLLPGVESSSPYKPEGEACNLPAPFSFPKKVRPENIAA